MKSLKPVTILSKNPENNNNAEKSEGDNQLFLVPADEAL